MGKKSRKRSNSDDEGKENRWEKRLRRLEQRIEEQNSLILRNINRSELIGYQGYRVSIYTSRLDQGVYETDHATESCENNIACRPYVQVRPVGLGLRPQKKGRMRVRPHATRGVGHTCRLGLHASD